MPQVPYRPDYQGSPVSETPQIRLNLPGAAFGVNIGEALQRRGGALTEFGNDVFGAAIKLQSQTNEFEARQKVADWETAAVQKQSEFDSLPPDQKKDQLPAHAKGLSDMRNAFESQLGAPEARLMFSRESQPFYGRLVFSAAGKTGEEFQKWRGEEGESNIARRVSAVSNGSENDLASKFKSIDEGYAAVASDLKYGPNTVGLRSDIAKSQAVHSTIDFWLANGNPDKALEIFNGPYGKSLLEKDRDVALSKINNNIISKVGIEEGMGMRKDNVPVDQIQSRAKAISEKYFANNAEARSQLEKNIVHNAMGDFYAEQSIDRMQNRKAMQSVYEVISSDDPRARSADSFQKNFPTIYGQLDERTKAELPAKLQEMWERHDKDSEKQHYDWLTRLAVTDKPAFLDQDILDSKLHLSKADTNHFISLRRQIISEGTYKDGEVQRGITLMNHTYPAELKALGVFQPPAKGVSNPVYDEYISQMQQGIQTFIEQYQHRPNDEEFKKYISPGLIRIRPRNIWERNAPGWLGGVSQGEKEPMELVPPTPPEDMEKIRKEVLESSMKSGAPMPTNREIEGAVAQMRWLKLLNDIEGSGRGRPTSGTTGPAGTPGTTQ